MLVEGHCFLPAGGIENMSHLQMCLSCLTPPVASTSLSHRGNPYWGKNPKTLIERGRNQHSQNQTKPKSLPHPLLITIKRQLIVMKMAEPIGQVVAQLFVQPVGNGIADISVEADAVVTMETGRATTPTP